MKDELQLKKERNNKILLIAVILLVAVLSSLITYKITIKNKKAETKQSTSQEEKKNEALTETKENIEDNTNVENNNELTNNDSESNNTTEDFKQHEQTSEIKTEEAVINYFEQEETYIINNQDNPDAISKIKESFKTLYDFIFNETEIKGYTFKELTTTAKLKVLKIALSIDNKIDSYFPDYKEKIKDKYTSLKEKVINKYLEITADLCTSNEELCKTASEDFETMKESYKLTLSVIKDVISQGSDKVKEWWANK